AGRRGKAADRPLPRGDSLAPLQPAYRAGVLVLDPLLRFLPRPQAPGGAGGGGSDGVSVLAGDRAQRRGGDAESGAVGASLSLPEGAWRRAAVARAVDAREAAGARAGGADRGGSTAAAGTAAWRQMGHGG